MTEENTPVHRHEQTTSDTPPLDSRTPEHEMEIPIDNFQNHFNEINVLQIYFLEAITKYRELNESHKELSSQKRIFALGTIIIRKASKLLDHPFLNHLRRRQIHGLIAQIDPIIENTISVLKTKNHLLTLHKEQKNKYTKHVIMTIVSIIIFTWLLYLLKMKNFQYVITISCCTSLVFALYLKYPRKTSIQHS